MSESTTTTSAIRTIPIPAHTVGMVIGQGGRQINNIKRISKCERLWVDTDIQENFGKQWTHVRISGTPHSQYLATLLVLSTIFPDKD